MMLWYVLACVAAYAVIGVIHGRLIYRRDGDTAVAVWGCILWPAITAAGLLMLLYNFVAWLVVVKRNPGKRDDLHSW